MSEDTTNLTPAQLRAKAFRLDAESDRNRAEANECRALATEREAAPVPASELVPRKQMADRIKRSEVTLSRLTADGCPCVYVGARAMYEPAAVFAWLAERGQKAAPKGHHVPRVPVADDVDVLDVPGLRRVGGAR